MIYYSIVSMFMYLAALVLAFCAGAKWFDPTLDQPVNSDVGFAMSVFGIAAATQIGTALMFN